MLSTIIETLPSRAQKQFAKTMIGSLNSSIIGNVRGHLRKDAMSQVSDKDDVPTIDDLNDAMAAVSEAEVRDQAFHDAGLAAIMPPIEVAQHLNTIREYLAEFLIQNKSTVYDIPLSIADTVKFQLERAPSINEIRLQALAKALNKDFKMLKNVQLEAYRIEREQLAKVAGQIITEAEALESDGDDEAAFDALPAHVRFKLVASAIKALDKTGHNALMQLLRFNKMDGATDHTLIEAVIKNCKQWLNDFQKANAAELDAYVERGGMLPEIDMPPTLAPEAILSV